MVLLDQGGRAEGIRSADLKEVIVIGWRITQPQHSQTRPAAPALGRFQPTQQHQGMEKTCPNLPEFGFDGAPILLVLLQLFGASTAR
jgi:hypothetical protein